MEEGHEGLFFCPEPNCQSSFQYITYLENHVLEGKHVYELQQLTFHDKARIGYAEGCKPGTSKQLSSGWHLKQTKKSKRFSKTKNKNKNKNKNKTKQNKKKKNKNKQTNKQTNQKDYLQKKFQVGMECGKKCQPSEVVRDMQRAKCDSGVKLWPRWVRWRISPSSRRRICTGQPPRHCPSKSISPSPYSVWHCVNVCHLVQSDTSQKLSLAKLKEICAFLDIDTSDILTKGRKCPFIKKIKAFTEDCSCHS